MASRGRLVRGVEPCQLHHPAAIGYSSRVGMMGVAGDGSRRALSEASVGARGLAMMAEWANAAAAFAPKPSAGGVPDVSSAELLKVTEARLMYMRLVHRMGAVRARVL